MSQEPRGVRWRRTFLGKISFLPWMDAGWTRMLQGWKRSGIWLCQSQTIPRSFEFRRVPGTWATGRDLVSYLINDGAAGFGVFGL